MKNLLRSLAGFKACEVFLRQNYRIAIGFSVFLREYLLNLISKVSFDIRKSGFGVNRFRKPRCPLYFVALRARYHLV